MTRLVELGSLNDDPRILPDAPFAAFSATERGATTVYRTSDPRIVEALRTRRADARHLFVSGGLHRLPTENAFGPVVDISLLPGARFHIASRYIHPDEPAPGHRVLATNTERHGRLGTIVGPGPGYTVLVEWDDLAHRTHDHIDDEIVRV